MSKTRNSNDRLVIANDSQTVSHLGKSLQTNVPARGDIQTNQMTTSHLSKPLTTGSSQGPGSGSSGQDAGKK